MDKQKMKKKLMPLTFSSQTALKDVFTKFFYNRLHPILIKDQPMILTETELLHFYFKKSHYHANLNQIMKQIMKRDRKSTRLNSSHVASSYAVFCLKKKNQKRT